MAEGRPCCAAVGGRLSPADLAALNADLRAGGSVRKVAERYSLGRTSIGEHRKCLGLAASSVDASSDASGQRLDRPDTGGRTAPDAPRLFDEVRALLRRARRLLRRVEQGDESVDFKAAAAFVRELRATLELQGKLQGELKAASTTVNVYSSPDWQRLRDALLAALEEHPAALAAVVTAIEAEQGRGALH